MKREVATQWHKIEEAIAADDFTVGVPANPVTRSLDLRGIRITSSLVKTIDLISAAKIPAFFVSEELCHMMCGDEVNHSIVALMDAGRTKLPYEHMIVEFDAPGDIECDGKRTQIKMRVITFIGDSGKGDWFVIMFRRAIVDGKPVTMLPAQTLIVTPAIIDEGNGIRKSGMDVQTSHVFWDTPNYKVYGDFEKARHEAARIDASDATVAVTAAMLLLHTKGVERDVVDVTKLNKSRVKAGKRAIIPHAVLHIGTITSRDGTKRKYVPGDKLMVPHWRRGHYRKQKYGPKWSMERDIYIEPMIVNYKGDDVAPARKTLAW